MPCRYWPRTISTHQQLAPSSESIEHCRRRELTAFADIFQNLVDDQTIEREIDTSMRSVDPQGDVIECDFCGSAIEIAIYIATIAATLISV